MTTAYLLDTNVVTAILRKESLALKHLEVRLRAGGRILVSALVVYEIQRGLLWRDAMGLLAGLESWLRHWEWLDVSRSHWEAAAVLWSECRKAGIKSSDTDLLLAVQARQEQAVLVTRDRDFDHLDVESEDWQVSLPGA